ncbi:hypothetical protein Ae201684P_005117 [Aphanomyces euteiches]|uniref:Uncharacterized protein n=1 Tax=Aphanomyces euteiches TaxID=100861 RepID=A0A6G0X4E0_9STRA|nr:hypothetical protein Ae201684_008653 [Aphanomyces euteiches]KAH9085409.1 hypothetical protein Ae201684P_005117 [Aphanomyces euteiches]
MMLQFLPIRLRLTLRGTRLSQIVVQFAHLNITCTQVFKTCVIFHEGQSQAAPMIPNFLHPVLKQRLLTVGSCQSGKQHHEASGHTSRGEYHAETQCVHTSLHLKLEHTACNICSISCTKWSAPESSAPLKIPVCRQDMICKTRGVSSL